MLTIIEFRYFFSLCLSSLSMCAFFFISFSHIQIHWFKKKLLLKYCNGKDNITGMGTSKKKTLYEWKRTPSVEWEWWNKKKKHRKWNETRVWKPKIEDIILHYETKSKRMKSIVYDSHLCIRGFGFFFLFYWKKNVREYFEMVTASPPVTASLKSFNVCYFLFFFFNIFGCCAIA